MNIIIQNFVSLISLRMVSKRDNINLTYHTNVTLSPPPLLHTTAGSHLKNKTGVQWSFNTKISQTI